MAKLPKRITERFSKKVGKFQNILRIAKDRDVNEADTVSIITDILADVFGYDKYLEVTSEFAIRGTYCDLAIKVKEKVQFLIEVKAIGIDLKENHLRQAIDYAANHGVQWVILTNGAIWKIYKMRFEQPINYDLVCTFNFIEINLKKEEDKEKLFIICREGLSKTAREDFHEKVQSVNRFVIGAVVQNDVVVNVIRRELRKMSAGIKVDNSDVTKLLTEEVLKREVIEGEKAEKAKKQVCRFYKKASKESKKAK
ncbi:type I restriction enzyme HsdR N-terminal domain-containing protein [bacterium]|nr:type I restriction enzyme HsdR N-terminal domain-containing protein [bacterium]